MTDLDVKAVACRYCGRKITFAADENGKTQVLDLVSPVYEVVENPVDDACRRNRRAFVSHFVTCPNREDARKKK